MLSNQILQCINIFRTFLNVFKYGTYKNEWLWNMKLELIIFFVMKEKLGKLLVCHYEILLTKILNMKSGKIFNWRWSSLCSMNCVMRSANPRWKNCSGYFMWCRHLTYCSQHHNNKIFYERLSICNSSRNFCWWCNYFGYGRLEYTKTKLANFKVYFNRFHFK